MSATIEQIESDDLKVQVPAIVTKAKTFSITSAPEYELGAELLKDIKAARAKADEFFDPGIKAAHEAHKIAVATKKRVTEQLDLAERDLKRTMLAYTAEQERIAEDERRKLQAIADEKARKEREALEAKARAAKKPETREKYAEAAAAVAPAPVIHVAPAVPKVAGVTVRETWTFEVKDRQAFMEWAAGAKRFDLLEPNEKMLGAIAKAQKEAASIPGIQFRKEANVASSRR